MKDLQRLYSERKEEVRERLKEFSKFRGAVKEQLFPELAFCLCTPQSKAKSCWEAVQELEEKGLLFKGSEKEVAKVLQKKVRFHNQKAKRILQARELEFGGGKDREWLFKNVKGLGMKEASHFLRNTGHGDRVAILDRHILKNLVKHGVIKEVPKILTPKKYLEIEKNMKRFAKEAGISLAELDLLFWAKETGEVFK